MAEQTDVMEPSVSVLERVEVPEMLPEPDAEQAAGAAETAEHSYVFAIGRVQWRYPNLGLQKEFEAAKWRAGASTDPQAFQEVLAQPHFRYLARQLCWVFTIEGVETYLLHPRDSSDFAPLLRALARDMEAPKATPAVGTHTTDVDVVIGIRGPLAPPGMCQGLSVPVVVFAHLDGFNVEAVLPPPPRGRSAAAAVTAGEPAARILQLADNPGVTDEQRALNFVVVRHSLVYQTASEMHGRGFDLAEVEVRPVANGGARELRDVVFSYRHRETNLVEQYFVGVDVTEEFPFLVQKLQRLYER